MATSLFCHSRPEVKTIIDFAIQVDVTVSSDTDVKTSVTPAIKTSVTVQYGAQELDFGDTGNEERQQLKTLPSVSGAVPSLPRIE
ncbi:hypothetical protein [Neptuniibacter sp.]|uniref:hypothetical protein n=1 Tax=Neptuniibacter sp. TaxID=1962643 RepID=UPI00261E702F|nr:hypothetical protein [Neptuniibacter sp.]MCP4597804.1 hypothetical protein [Neptuniibacter sp.]